MLYCFIDLSTCNLFIYITCRIFYIIHVCMSMTYVIILRHCYMPGYVHAFYTDFLPYHIGNILTFSIQLVQKSFPIFLPQPGQYMESGNDL